MLNYISSASNPIMGQVSIETMHPLAPSMQGTLILAFIISLSIILFFLIRLTTFAFKQKKQARTITRFLLLSITVLITGIIVFLLQNILLWHAFYFQ